MVREVRFRNKETITGSKTMEEVNMQRQNNEAKTPGLKIHGAPEKSESQRETWKERYSGS